MNRIRVGLFAAPLAAVVPALLAQSTKAAPDGPHFDAASVKRLPRNAVAPPFKVPPNGVLLGREHGRYTLHHFTLKNLIATAYSWEVDRVVTPDWMDSERYDVDAIMPVETTDANVLLMLLRLLNERFRLAVHVKEQAEPMYALLVGKNGPKLQKAKGDGPHRFMDVSQYGFDGLNQDMNGLAFFLSRWTDHPVVNMTGLSGTYDFKLFWKEDSTVAPNPNGQFLVDPVAALHSVTTLGLRVERRSGSTKTLIVDHAEKDPTGN
jgi:uncharacterized protein (TIGR03435 family)